MPVATHGTSVDFDLRDASRQFLPFVIRRRRILIGSVVFVAALLVITIVSPSKSGVGPHQSPYLTINTVTALACLSAVLGANLAVLSRERPGADRLTVAETGFELDYPGGRKVGVLWTDPHLEFELMDCTQVNPSKLGTPGLPYSIRLNGRRSLITKDAFFEMLAQVENRNLVDIRTRGSRWFFPADANPVIHRIHPAVPRTALLP
jgi:hypothetical protein